MPPEPANWRRNPAAVVFIALALMLHAGLACDAARQLTVTHDEYWHLPVGLLSWKTGRFDFDNLNPPLVRMWAALPLLLMGESAGTADATLSAQGYGDAFLAANPVRYHTLYAISRCMIVALSVATGLLLAIWSRALFGVRAACLTVWLWCLCPSVLANASLVTTDLGAAFFFVATLFQLWKFANRPSWANATCLGVCLGLAQLAKFTCVLLYPIAIVLWFVLRGGSSATTPPRRGKLWLQWLALLALSLFVLGAGYLFQGEFRPLGAYQFRSHTFNSMQRWGGFFPVPLPGDYVQGLDHQQSVMEGTHPVYLDGEWSTTGLPQYYFLVLLYKLPHALQLLCGLSSLWLVWPGKQLRLWRVQTMLLTPPLLMLAMGSSVNMQLGLRYVLPALPFLILFAGQGGRWFDWRKSPWRTVAIAVVAMATPFNVRFHPGHLAYFNELADGPIGGRWHLLDSNLDWGQDLRELRAYIDKHPMPDLGLAYFGTVPPSALGIKYRVPPSFAPQPGWYAVSVNFVQGRPHTVRDPSDKVHPVGLDEFGYFRFFRPVAHVGYSIDIFHLDWQDIARWEAARRRMQP